MAKQLLSSYTFTPGAANAGTVVVPGSYTLEQFLLITNVTSGTILYQFNVPSKGATLSTGGGNTTLTLEFSTQSMSAADRLQVFIDDGTVTGGGAGSGLTDTQLRATPVPVSVSGVATAANQSTANSSLSSIDGKLPAQVSGRVPVDIGSASVTITGPVTVSNEVEVKNDTGNPVPASIASLPLPSGAATAANQSTANTSLNNLDVDLGAQADAAATSDSGTFSLIALFKRQLGNWTTLLGRIPSLTVSSTRLLVDGSGVTQPVSGTFWQATQPVSGSVTRALTPALLTSYSQAGAISAGTALATLDCSVYRSISIQCTSMGTSGVVTPEWSNDNTNWLGATILTLAGATVPTFSAAGLWVVPVQARYLRLRLSGATTGGTTTLSIHQFDDSRQMWLATQPVSGTVTANIGTGSLAAGTNAIGDAGIQYRANATGAAGIVSVLSPATPAAATIKASAGRLLGYQLQNSSASLRSVKLFNATAPTLGTTAAAFEIDIPAGAMVTFNLEGGIGFSTACTYSVTSAKGLTDNTATGLAANDVSGAFFFA